MVQNLAGHFSLTGCFQLTADIKGNATSMLLTSQMDDPILTQLQK
jgi:hypothetical protein